jgi:hypothetical protein
VNGLGHSIQSLEICDGVGAGFSLGPAGAFAAGTDICIGATSNVDIALQNPSPMPRVTWRFLMDVSVATETSVSRREPAVVVAGCFMTEGCERFGASRA